MLFPIATYDEEMSLNQGVYETKNKPIMAVFAHARTVNLSSLHIPMQILWSNRRK